MRIGRKRTGGKYQPSKKKKLYEKPGQRRITKLGDEKRKSKKTEAETGKYFCSKLNPLIL